MANHLEQFLHRKACIGDTDLIHVKERAGGLALAEQVNFTWAWPTYQFFSIPWTDISGATGKQKATKVYNIQNVPEFIINATDFLL